MPLRAGTRAPWKTGGAADDDHLDPYRPRWRGRPFDLGRPHGPDRREPRVRPPPSASAELRTRQPLQGICGGARRHGHLAKQHGYRADGHVVRGGRAGRSRPGARGHARRECGDDADRSGALLQRVGGFLPADPARRCHVPPKLGHPHARSRAGWRRAWPDADRPFNTCSR